MTKITTVSAVRNESDIIESFVRHHLQWVDSMTIVIHRPTSSSASCDNTEAILTALKEEGLPLDIRVLAEKEYRQRDIVTALARELGRRQKTGWILPLDADEFMVDEAGHDLRNTLQGLSDETAFAVSWRTYVPSPKDEENELNPSKRIQHHCLEEPQVIQKVIVPARLAAHRKSSISGGSHRFKIGGDALMRDLQSITLAHFPIRSGGQLRAKVFGAWLSYLAIQNKKDGPTVHWKKFYDHLSKNQEITPQQLQELATTYVTPGQLATDIDLVHQPISTFDGHLKYEPLPINPWALLAETAETLAQELNLRSHLRFKRGKPLLKLEES